MTIFRKQKERDNMNEVPEWLEKITNLPNIDNNIRTFGGHKRWVPKGWSIPTETHFAFEIIMIVSGTQKTVFEGRSMKFQAGDIVLIPPGTVHENFCVSEEGMEYFCVHFDIDDPKIQQKILMYCPILLEHGNSVFPQIEAIIRNYIQLLDEESFSIQEKLNVEINLLKLVLSLVNYAKEVEIQIDHSDNTSLILAKTIAETIQKNFRLFTREPKSANEYLLSMEFVANSLNISKSTMLKAFKKVYSISPKKYLDQIKYNEAKFLLHQPKVSINEISEVLGYKNASHFSRQFKSWSQISPKDYRQTASQMGKYS